MIFEYWTRALALRHALASLGLSLLITVSMVIPLTVPETRTRIQHEQSRFFQVQIAVDTESKSVVAQLFFDIGRGFNADDSV
ncbi:MAG: hypothetical protein LJE65_00410, partial [Desulfobacteraceae bacterium]|nr:hypothetical protein [Desulfobacteraceae bacterium]